MYILFKEIFILDIKGEIGNSNRVSREPMHRIIPAMLDISLRREVNDYFRLFPVKQPDYFRKLRINVQLEKSEARRPLLSIKIRQKQGWILRRTANTDNLLVGIFQKIINQVAAGKRIAS